MKSLSAEADAARSYPSDETRTPGDIRDDLAAALAAEYPMAAAAAAAAAAAGAGKKGIVRAAVAAIVDLGDPTVVRALKDVATASSWRDAIPALIRLGFAGELLSQPTTRGLRLPCAPHACPSPWGTNWGLPCVQEVAKKLADRS